MANKKHLAILLQGHVTWNQWRRQHPNIKPNLGGAQLPTIDLFSHDLTNANLIEANLQSAVLRNLSGAELARADLRRAKLFEAMMAGTDLESANLQGAEVTRADLTHANLNFTNLSWAFAPGVRLSDSTLARANLDHTDLRGAKLLRANINNSRLTWANLAKADLTEANLYSTDLSHADLSEANFTSASLHAADLYKANLTGANFTRCQVGFTVFSGVAFCTAKGLDTVRHLGPSTIGIDSLLLSEGMISEDFLRGAGIPEPLIDYLPSLLTKESFYSCFISYSRRDKPFAELLYSRLQSKGIRCWLDEHQLLPGDDIHDEIDLGVRLWDKTLLCCSEASLKDSPWVDREIDKALQKEEELWKERKQKVLALIPINLDGYLLQWKSGKASALKSRICADFRDYDKDDRKFEEQFERLLKALRADAQAREKPPESKL